MASNNLSQLKATVLQPPSLGIKGAYSRQARAKQELKQRALLEELDAQKTREKAVMRARRQQQE